MLSRAVVAEPAFRAPFLRAVLEVVDARAGAVEQLANGLELGRLGLVGGAGDRKLVVGELVVGLGERDRLDRLRG